MLLATHAAYSNCKAAFQCACDNKKHTRFLGVQQVARNSNVFACRICEGKGSSYEQLIYSVLNEEPLVKLFTVESAAVGQKIRLAVAGTPDGIHLNRHLWDAVTLDPPSLLIEVQGEGHTCKEDGRCNNGGDTLAIRQAKDEALATAANAQGFSVLWLFPTDPQQLQVCKTKWAAGLQQALSHVMANNPAQLFKC